MIVEHSTSSTGQCLVSSFTSNIDSNFKELALDLLTVIANKPTNFNGLNRYFLQELRETAFNYASIRHPGRSESDIRLCMAEVESIFEKCNIDIISFEGREEEVASVSPRFVATTPTSAYYAREKELQKIVQTVFHQELDSSITNLVQSKRTREVEVLKTWMAILWGRNTNGPRTIPLQMDRFAHHYQREFSREMPVGSIDPSTVIEILTRGRLAYPVDNESALCPMWITDKDWLETTKSYFETKDKEGKKEGDE